MRGLAGIVRESLEEPWSTHPGGDRLEGDRVAVRQLGDPSLVVAHLLEGEVVPGAVTRRHRSNLLGLGWSDLTPPRSAEHRAPFAALRLRVFLRRARFELEADEALIAQHPRIMSRLDHVGIAGPNLGLGPVLVCDVEPAGLDNAHVPDLAAVRAHDRLHALRPLPARLECHPGGGRTPYMDHINASLFGGSRLVR